MGLSTSIRWRTGIPKPVYAKLYCSWKRVRREVEFLARIFREHGASELVEFGCGLGRHGYLLNRMGFNVLLTDARDWRYGVARRLPFVKLDVLSDDLRIGRKFDGGYGVNFLTIFEYGDMVKALKNIGRIVGSGIVVLDYNFAVYGEPREMRARVRGVEYRAILEKESVKPTDGGAVYGYRIKVVDAQDRVVGIEESSYPVYSKDVVLRAIREAGLKVVDMLWVTWDPVEYAYRPSSSESDSAFIVLAKASHHLA